MARADVKQITGDTGGAAVEVTFTAPAPGNQVMTIPAIHSKHHFSYDANGKPVNSRNAHVSFSESNVEAGYPIRNAAGEVHLHGHRVLVKDSTGADKQYMIREWFPDETIGLIVCILGDFE